MKLKSSALLIKLPLLLATFSSPSILNPVLFASIFPSLQSCSSVPLLVYCRILAYYCYLLIIGLVLHYCLHHLHLMPVHSHGDKQSRDPIIELINSSVTLLVNLQLLSMLRSINSHVLFKCLNLHA